MSWSKYVKQHLAGRNQTELAAVVGVSQAAISRWLKDSQGVDADKAVEFARRVGDTPIAALVAAGFLTPDEARVRPAAAPDFTQLSNDELLELVRARMREEVGSDAGSAAANQTGDGDLVNNPENVVTLRPEPTADDIVRRYLELAEGDAGQASGLLGHDGPKAAQVPEAIWEAALTELGRLRDAERGPGEPGQQVARETTEPPLLDEPKRQQDEDAERGDKPQGDA